MVEREKVIKGLQICSQSKSEHKQCPYYPHNTDDKDCITKLTSDALASLKEYDEGVTPIVSTTEQKKFADRIGLAVSDFWCGACRFNLVGHPKFCQNCGKKVKWDEL